MKKLVIVESPTKAKTIKKFLPKGYEVDSSFGHVRDLPASAKEIPAKYKKEKWASMGINTDDGFTPLYVISKEKKKVVNRLKEKLKDADELILATDEDREGEGISWHLLDVLQPKVPARRMVFHEITKEAIQESLTNFREVNLDLVNAQETRRFLDRLAGYTISPLLWKKIAPGLSAGRVQSVAVELLVVRERARLRFKTSSYWDLKAQLQTEAKKVFDAQLSHVNGKRVASGKDFDESTGGLKKNADVELINDARAHELAEAIKSAAFKVLGVETNNQKRSPAPPFITSTLQQEANRKLGFSAKQTMGIAQKLYESGFITYMRTDSTNLSSQAIAAARSAVENLYGDTYLSPSVRTYGKKVKGAQEAHEAIRPAGSSFQRPEETGLSGQEFKLYDLIWKRTMATQMADAQLKFTNVEILASKGDLSVTFKASGKEIQFPGFFRAYVEGSDDPEAQLENQEAPLPSLSENDPLKCNDLDAIGHETKPPARFTEASLVRELEKEGVGRPSTYATIIDTIVNRDYARRQGNALVPTFTAFAVSSLLEKHFPDLVDVKFTSEMESKLDDIASGKQDWVQYLDSYYNGAQGLKELTERQETEIVAADARKLDIKVDGAEEYEVFVGRFGPYVQLTKDGQTLSKSLPHDLNPAELTKEKIEELIKEAEEGPESLGKDPETGKHIFLLSGRFGPYVQLGEVTEEEKKPKRGSLLKGMQPEDVTLDVALQLLSLPRALGNHPETGKEIRAGVGRFGPFVVHDGAFKSLAKTDDVLTIDLERAVALLAEKKVGRGGSKAEPLKTLGEHPEGGEIVILDGRYGPYIKYGKTNVSLGKGKTPESVSLEEAIELIAQKKK